jgi:hypothetical protein
MKGMDTHPLSVRKARTAPGRRGSLGPFCTLHLSEEEDVTADRTFRFEPLYGSHLPSTVEETG